MSKVKPGYYVRKYEYEGRQLDEVRYVHRSYLHFNTLVVEWNNAGEELSGHNPRRRSTVADWLEWANFAELAT